MNKHFKKIIEDSNDIASQLRSWFVELSRVKQIGIVIIFLLIITTVGRSLLRTSTTEEVKKLSRAVTLSSVSDLSANTSRISLLGTVTSVNEATIRAESGGQLRVVYKKLGDYVMAGQIIAEFENSAERASVTASEGGYEQAKASRDIARINKGSSDTSLSDTKTSAINTIASTYNTMDDAIRVKSNPLFSNPDNTQAELLLTVPDQALTIKIKNEKVLLENVLTSRALRNKTLSQNSDLIAELTTLEEETKQVKTYLDDVALALSKSLPNGTFSQSALDGFKINITNARSQISGSLSSIVGSRSALNGSITSSAIAKTNYSDTATGASSASSDAQVKSALGNYQASLARLEKTIVRSPLSGTLNSLSITTGDYIAPYTEIGVVSNNGALEVVAYGTEEDMRQLSVGAKVSIGETASGVVTKVASALDPRTKKIEVRVGITSGAQTLVNGESVRVSIARPLALTQSALQTKKLTSTKIEIPISALKITPQGSFVFTVVESTSTPYEGVLVSHKVTEGALLGDKIQILEGVTPEMILVTDVRGLQAGKTVTIAE
jgi:multidrug efflux pump subunit AcrA (membrane-fusion protein)